MKVACTQVVALGSAPDASRDAAARHLHLLAERKGLTLGAVEFGGVQDGFLGDGRLYSDIGAEVHRWSAEAT